MLPRLAFPISVCGFSVYSCIQASYYLGLFVGEGHLIRGVVTLTARLYPQPRTGDNYSCIGYCLRRVTTVTNFVSGHTQAS